MGDRIITITTGVWNFLKIGGTISTIISSIGFFTYLLGYSFLYGYYFSGDTGNIPSLLSIIVNPIPFSSITLFSISGLIIISVVFLGFCCFNFKTTNIIRLFSGLLFVFVFHLCLSIIFIGGTDLISNALKFSIIWLVPIIITFLLMFFLRMMVVPHKAFSGLLFGFFLFLSVETLFKVKVLTYDWNIILGQISILLFAILFSFIKIRNKFFKLCFIFPYIFFISLLSISLLKLSYIKVGELNLYVFEAIILLISIIYVLMFPKFWPENFLQKFTSQSEMNFFDIKGVSQIFIKEKRFAFMIIILMVLVLITFSSYTSLLVGQTIRDFTPKIGMKKEKITDLSQKEVLVGIIVAEKDNTLYISNSEWELEKIKSNSVSSIVYK